MARNIEDPEFSFESAQNVIVNGVEYEWCDGEHEEGGGYHRIPTDKEEECSFNTERYGTTETHCVHWWDCEPCCACGALAPVTIRTEDELRQLTRP